MKKHPRGRSPPRPRHQAHRHATLRFRIARYPRWIGAGGPGRMRRPDRPPLLEPGGCRRSWAVRPPLRSKPVHPPGTRPSHRRRSTANRPQSPRPGARPTGRSLPSDQSLHRHHPSQGPMHQTNPPTDCGCGHHAIRAGGAGGLRRRRFRWQNRLLTRRRPDEPQILRLATPDSRRRLVRWAPGVPVQSRT
jgi:hypothetical protein